MKPNKLSNISSYSEIEKSLSTVEEPLISLDLRGANIQKVKDLLAYEGINELKIPGSFLSVVTEITSFPISLLIDILDISKSTFYRVKDGKSLEQATIDKLAVILKIYNKGLKTFDNRDDLHEWLNSRIVSLGNNKPIDLLKTENGRSAVLDTIDRIEHGIYG